MEKTNGMRTEQMNLRSGEFVLESFSGKNHKEEATKLGLNKAFAYNNHKFRRLSTDTDSVVLAISIEDLKKEALNVR